MTDKDFNFYTCMTDGSLDWTPAERAASDAKVAENHRRIAEACMRMDEDKAERIRRAQNSKLQEITLQVRTGNIARNLAKHNADQDVTITAIADKDIDGQVADLIIENAQGRWYGASLSPANCNSQAFDWDYISDNGEYIGAD